MAAGIRSRPGSPPPRRVGSDRPAGLLAAMTLRRRVASLISRDLTVPRRGERHGPDTIRRDSRIGRAVADRTGEAGVASADVAPAREVGGRTGAARDE